MHIDINKPILDKNNRIAIELRERYKDNKVYVLNILASPGAGKTSTITATIKALRDTYHIAVIEGDIAGSIDAERIKELGVQAVQINTGGSCHLESTMVKRAVDMLNLDEIDLILIENVGNLVCTTDFDLGESDKAVILSVPEGDDKPIKYPGIFEAAGVVLLNKYDTLPYFNFDKDAFLSHVHQLNHNVPVFPLSATKGEGVDGWSQWLREQIEALKNTKSGGVLQS